MAKVKMEQVNMAKVKKIGKNGTSEKKLSVTTG